MWHVFEGSISQLMKVSNPSKQENSKHFCLSIVNFKRIVSKCRQNREVEFKMARQCWRPEFRCFSVNVCIYFGRVSVKKLLVTFHFVLIVETCKILWFSVEVASKAGFWKCAWHRPNRKRAILWGRDKVEFFKVDKHFWRTFLGWNWTLRFRLTGKLETNKSTL